MWDAKTEPGVVKIFEEIWGTDKLTVSFGKSKSSVIEKANSDPARRCKLLGAPAQGAARRWWSTMASYGPVSLEAPTRLYPGYSELITQRSQRWWIDCRHWIDQVL
jgi:hypothetical protein